MKSALSIESENYFPKIKFMSFLMSFHIQFHQIIDIKNWKSKMVWNECKWLGKYTLQMTDDKRNMKTMIR